MKRKLKLRQRPRTDHQKQVDTAWAVGVVEGRKDAGREWEQQCLDYKDSASRYSAALDEATDKIKARDGVVDRISRDCVRLRKRIQELEHAVRSTPGLTYGPETKTIEESDEKLLFTDDTRGLPAINERGDILVGFTGDEFPVWLAVPQYERDHHTYLLQHQKEGYKKYRASFGYEGYRPIDTDKTLEPVPRSRPERGYVDAGARGDRPDGSVQRDREDDHTQEDPEAQENDATLEDVFAEGTTPAVGQWRPHPLGWVRRGESDGSDGDVRPGVEGEEEARRQDVFEATGSEYRSDCGCDLCREVRGEEPGEEHDHDCPCGCRP